MVVDWTWLINLLVCTVDVALSRTGRGEIECVARVTNLIDVGRKLRGVIEEY